MSQDIIENPSRPSQRLLFFIGTTAELIKLYPVMVALRTSGSQFEVIASGQNHILDSDLLRSIVPDQSIRSLSSGPKKASVSSLLNWFLKTLLKSASRRSPLFGKASSADVKMIVHGDTISTLMGALLAWRYGLTLCHIEAGLRSFNLLRPFPEEICRVIVSIVANESYCPNHWATENLRNISNRRSNGSKVINTQQNTLVDSLQYALEQKPCNLAIELLPAPYFVFVLHRQENLFDAQFVRLMVSVAIAQSLHCRGVMILHEPTRVTLEKLGLMSQLKAANIELLPRLPYVDFTHLLSRCDFIMTDGGSNQEESYYLGVPCLILRTETERNEGLGHNALLSYKRPEEIRRFLADWSRFRQPRIVPQIPPSVLIASELLKSDGAHVQAIP